MSQSGLTHPSKLGFDRGKSILGVIIGSANQIQELAMKFGGGGSNNLKVGERTVGVELLGNLTEQDLLALIFEMMD